MTTLATLTLFVCHWGQPAIVTHGEDSFLVGSCLQPSAHMVRYEMVFYVISLAFRIILINMYDQRVKEDLLQKV